MIAGCPYRAGTPFDDDDGATRLQEDVWQLCERVGFTDDACERVVAAVALEEQRMSEAALAVAEQER